MPTSRRRKALRRIALARELECARRRARRARRCSSSRSRACTTGRGCSSRRGREALRAAAAGRRSSRSPTRSSPRGSPSRPAWSRRSALAALADLKGASGRLELVGAHPSGALVFVDYAHTPDALANALAGAAAACRRQARRRVRRRRRPRSRQTPADGRGRGRENADRLIVTDDNPRSEDPAAIRKAVLGGAPGAEEIGDRREAIRAAVGGAADGRHPAHRRQGPRNRPDDRRQGAALLRPGGGAPRAAGRRRRRRERCSGRPKTSSRPPAGGWRAIAPAGVSGISIDSRTVAPGDAFVAIRGERFDGHDYVAAALAGRARRSPWRAKGARRRRRARCSSCRTIRSTRSSGSGAAARARMRGAVVAVTGSVGKTGTKEMLRLALSELGPTHAPVGSFNNHWGVPLTLAAHAGGRPPTASSRSA